MNKPFTSRAGEGLAFCLDLCRKWYFRGVFSQPCVQVHTNLRNKLEILLALYRRDLEKSAFILPININDIVIRSLHYSIIILGDAPVSKMVTLNFIENINERNAYYQHVISKKLKKGTFSIKRIIIKMIIALLILAYLFSPSMFTTPLQALQNNQPQAPFFWAIMLLLILYTFNLRRYTMFKSKLCKSPSKEGRITFQLNENNFQYEQNNRGGIWPYTDIRSILRFDDTVIIQLAKTKKKRLKPLLIDPALIIYKNAFTTDMRPEQLISLLEKYREQGKQ